MIFPFKQMTEEEINERKKENYRLFGENPENLSYWFPKINNSTTKSKSLLQLPKTKVVTLDFETWNWLRSDNYTEEKISEFNNIITNELEPFLEGETLFMKSGVFSDKFCFFHTVVDDRNKIGRQFLDMYYNSMIFGADRTTEVVFRQMVKDKESRKKIYEGMPLHTEFRVFYDFDSHEVVGIANYWQPKLMETHLSGQDLVNYMSEQKKINTDYEKHKEKVIEEIKLFMEGCHDLKGKWSIDVMKNADEFWLIDMARMNKSALVEHMEEVK